MRWISMLTALLVTVALYMLVMERDRVLAMAGAVPPEPAAEAPAPEAARQVSVVVQDSTAEDIAGIVLLRGETRAARQVEVRAETSGRVISEPLRKGASVETGQVLCRLDPGTREATLAQAEAALAEARARLPEARAGVTQAESLVEEAEINDRAARGLADSGFASETRLAASASAVATARAQLASAQAGLEAARTAIRTAEAAVAAAKTELDRLTIMAPFAGVLDTDAAELGALMQPGALCATVIQLDPIRLMGYVPETELDRVRQGAMAVGRLSSGHEVAGHVSFVARTADPATRTFLVEVEVENDSGTIRSGETVEIRIGAPPQSAHLLPQSALTLDDAGRLGVRLAVDGVARFAPVALLRDTTEGVWVAGLPERAAVIVVGQDFVTDGVALNVIEREARP